MDKNVPLMNGMGGGWGRNMPEDKYLPWHLLEWPLISLIGFLEDVFGRNMPEDVCHCHCHCFSHGMHQFLIDGAAVA